MATHDWVDIDELALFLNGTGPGAEEWGRDFKALGEARNKLEDLVGLLRADPEAARATLRGAPVAAVWDVIVDPSSGPRLSALFQGRTPMEYALWVLSRVCEGRQFDRLRQCKREACGRWFVAKDAKKGFCSADCQQEYWAERRKTAEVKTERAEARKRQRKSPTGGKRR